jgi:hypothetical protein
MSESSFPLADFSQKGTYPPPGSKADGTPTSLLSDIKIVQKLPCNVGTSECYGTESNDFKNHK